MIDQQTIGVPQDVAAIRAEIALFFRKRTEEGYPIGGYLGVYVFFDYDGEPIYVGQTHEGLSSRVGRHLTNQRTDAVAMNVLDPFEVAFIEVFPLIHKTLKPKSSKEDLRLLTEKLNQLEFSVYKKVLEESRLNAVLNEKDIAETAALPLPVSFKSRIIPDSIFNARQHPDVRIARRSSTIARLAQVISERDVSPGLRRTLLVQARRLERLAAERFKAFANKVETASPGEETGDSTQ